MKVLAVFDEKNYTDEMPEYERYCVRGVIIRDGKIAMQKGKSLHYHGINVKIMAFLTRLSPRKINTKFSGLMNKHVK